MPTPFMHLHIAEQILAGLSAGSDNGRIHAQLAAEWPAFYLGSVAPDVNAISELTRAQTHFYTMPPAADVHAPAVMLEQYPTLAQAGQLSMDRAVFVAAYQAHLLLDLIWLRDVVYPYFVQVDHLGDRQQRELTHLILLTYLDALAVEALPDTAVSTLAHAQPQQWLPFVADEILNDWRDMLVAQLSPNASLRTIEIYASRLGIAATQFAQNLQDKAWMDDYVFGKIPVAAIQAILTEAVPRSIKIISNYLQE